MKTGIKDAGRASGFELANGSFTNLPIDLAKFALNRLPLALSRIFRRRPGNYVDGLLSPFQRISFGPLASSFPPWIHNDLRSPIKLERKFARMVLGTNWFERFIQGGICDYSSLRIRGYALNLGIANILTLCAFHDLC